MANAVVAVLTNLFEKKVPAVRGMLFRDWLVDEFAGSRVRPHARAHVRGAALLRHLGSSRPNSAARCALQEVSCVF